MQATRGYGADVILHGTCVEDALSEALAFAERTGAVFIHPYDHPDIVAGQGTLGFEIIEQCPQVRTVVVPVGGGGLTAGITVAVKALDPEITVVGCLLPDHPGSLAKLLTDLADHGANVLEVGHDRLAPRLDVDEVEVVLQIETRGPEHCGEVIAALRAAGYTLAFA